MIELSTLQTTPTYLVAILIFLFILIFYNVGYRTRIGVLKKNPDQSTIELTAINGTLLGLLGLLLAFTFSMASSRFDTRRQLIIEEANDIGTVILRTDVYPDSVRELLRADLKKYVEERIAFFQVGMDLQKAKHHYLKADSIGKHLWAITANYAKVDNITTRTSEIIPALNAMIDITTTRRAAGESTIPDSIMYFLFSLCFCSAFLLGYDNKHKKIDRIVLAGFALMLSITIYMIIDLDRPRSGLINMNKAHEKMVELLESF